MIYVNAGGIRDSLKQDLALEFCRKQNKCISILTETHVTHDQIRQIKINWLGPIFFSPGNSHTKGLLSQFHLGLEGVTEVYTDLKGRFVLFRVTLYNNKVLWISATSGHDTREQLVRGRSFDRLQNYMEKSVREMKTKLYLKTLKIKMDKIDRDGGNKTQRLYRCCSKGPGYTESTLILNLLTMPKRIT